MRRQKKAARETSEARGRSSDVKEKHSRRWGEQRVSQPRSQLNPGMLVFEYAEWFNLTKCGLIIPYVQFFCLHLKVESEKRGTKNKHRATDYQGISYWETQGLRGAHMFCVQSTECLKPHYFLRHDPRSCCL